MARGFEKVSFEQFKNDFNDNKILYEEYLLPKRGTKHSAGYDFFAIEEFTIKPGEIKKIPTGCKSYMGASEVLMILVRSSMGFKYNVRMCNQVGIVDSDYYNNGKNEGHIYVALQNHGEQEYTVKKGEAYAQGIFTNYLMTDNDDAAGLRVGGIGSTNKKGEKQ